MKVVDIDFSNVLPGDILYADFSYTHFWNVCHDKNPIGIILYVNKIYNVGVVVALEEAPQALTWSDTVLGHPFAELRVVEEMEECYNIRLSEEDTAKIIETGLKTKVLTPAASFCAQYRTRGTDPGDWYLPSIVELHLLKELLNLFKGWKLFTSQINQTDFYWSSTECTYNKAFAYCFGAPMYFPKQKSEEHRVRPFLLVANRFALLRRAMKKKR